jgi:hypothetical protein
MGDSTVRPAHLDMPIRTGTWRPIRNSSRYFVRSFNCDVMRDEQKKETDLLGG